MRTGFGGLALVAGLAGAALARQPLPAAPASGPAADYPVVLGAPFTLDGVTYTPADTMNYDQVGYALVESAAGPGVTIAHRTLPLPSYAEVTSLRTGRTIVVRVERRGPMVGAALVALSPDAATQLGTAEERTPIRIRRVNPPEPERALVRAGQRAPERMDTPMSLVGVLLRKLDPALAPLAPPPASIPAAAWAPAPAAIVAPGPKRPAVMPPQLKPVTPDTDRIPAPPPLPAPPQPAKIPAPPVAATHAAKPSLSPGKSTSVIQVGAFSSQENATRAAAKTGGTVSPAGRLFRVRIGGFATVDAARAALAKAKAAGYSDARILPAD